MDVVDQQIFDTILQLDPTFFDSFGVTPSTIAELSPQMFYGTVVQLLWFCNGSIRKQIPSRHLPQNIASRFRSANMVIDAIKALGVRDPIDYHTLMYGHGKEMRNVLIGLIEKLPKESPVISTSEDPLKALLKCAFDGLGDGDQTASKYLNEAHSSSWGFLERVRFTGYNGDVSAACSCADWRLIPSAYVCAILECNAKSNALVGSNNGILNALRDAVQCSSLTAITSVALPLSLKPFLPPKPSKKPQLTSKPMTKETALVEDTLRKEISLLLTELRQKEAIVDETLKKTALVSSELERMEALEMEQDHRFQKLLEEPLSVDKLQKYIDESNERMEKLQNSWFEVKTEKNNEMRKARENAKTVLLSGSTASKTEMLKEMADVEKEIAKKKLLLDKLGKQVDKSEEKQISRTVYKKHIFDLVASIKKQGGEISKIANEISRVQKSIKAMVGKVERAFTVVEEKIYGVIERDIIMQKAYKLLIKIHQECAWAISSIDDSGRTECEIEEISDRIALQRQKKTDEKLENVVNDWLEVKKENNEMEELLERKKS